MVHVRLVHTSPTDGRSAARTCNCGGPEVTYCPNARRERPRENKYGQLCQTPPVVMELSYQSIKISHQAREAVSDSDLRLLSVF